MTTPNNETATLKQFLAFYSGCLQAVGQSGFITPEQRAISEVLWEFHETELEKSRNQVRILTEALEWYADGANYLPTFYLDGKVFEKANKALAKSSAGGVKEEKV